MEQYRGGSRTSTKGGTKLNNRAQSGRDHFVHGHFNETTHTLLPQEINSKRSNGTQRFQPTNRFLAVKSKPDQGFLGVGRVLKLVAQPYVY